MAPAPAFVPEWAKYPFEICVVPRRRVACPAQMNDDEIVGYASLLDEAAKNSTLFLMRLCRLQWAGISRRYGHMKMFSIFIAFFSLFSNGAEQK